MAMSAYASGMYGYYSPYDRNVHQPYGAGPLGGPLGGSAGQCGGGGGAGQQTAGMLALG